MVEQALEHRRLRTRTGSRTRKARVYALSGPLVCEACGRRVKGNVIASSRQRRYPVYRHYDAAVHDCPGWSVKQVPVEILEDQIGQMLEGAAPNRETATRVRVALQSPPAMPDRLRVARIDSRLRALGLEMVALEARRAPTEILAEIMRLKEEREQLLRARVELDGLDRDDTVAWLANLGKLWHETDDEGRRAMAINTFARIGATSGARRGSHRIVSVKLTEAAERRGLALTLPATLTASKHVYGGRDRSVRELCDWINPAIANGNPPVWARLTWSGPGG